MDLGNAVNIAVPFTAGREGFRANPYWDVNGYAIGYGNHYYEDGSPVTSDDGPITRERAQELLTYFVTQAAQTVASALSVDVPDSLLAGLTDLQYNWGRVPQSQVLNLINSGAPPDQVTAQWQATATTSAGVTNLDLISRRAAEAQLAYSSGENTLGAVALVLVAAFVILFIVNAKKS
jgi:lysozyme